MPRFDAQRITPRQAVDSSQSANIALPVQASLDSVRGQGSAMFAMSRALSSMSGNLADTAAANNARKAKAQHDQDKKDGAAKAAEKDVTGADQSDWLQTASETARASYEETDGINAVNRFEQSIQPELARLEPGSDIDGFIQQHVEKYIADNGLSEGARKSFMVGLSKSQDTLKETFLKQSIAESLKRDEDGVASLFVSGLQKGDLLTPQGYATWRQYAAEKGLHDTEIDDMAVKAVKASLASGDIDIAKGMALLSPELVNQPEHKEELQLAAKRGETIQKERAQKARYDQEVADTVQVDALADKGILGKSRALAWGKANDKTAAEVAAKLNSSREAASRLAAKAAKAHDEQKADLAWRNHDALAENRAGLKPDDVAKAGDRAFTSALQSGDDAQVQAVLEHSARTGAPIPALKGILSGSIDENDPKRATRYVQIYERMQHISPEWAARQVDDKTLARITQYQTAKVLGADDMQAWSKVKMGTNLDNETISRNTTEAMKLVAKDSLKDFDDGGWFGSDTKIANTSELESAYRISVRDMVMTGASPEDAAKAALTRVKSSYIRVGDRMVRYYGLGDGMEQQTSDAMTEASVMWKDRLVAQNVVGKDDPVWFVPVPGSPNTWRLKYFAAGGVPLDVTHEVTQVGADGTEHKATAFVDVIPSATRANYSAWKKREDDKKTRNEQTFKTLGSNPEDLTPEAAARLTKQLALRGKPLDPNDKSPYALDQRAVEQRQKTAKLSEYVANPANHLQSFADFITSQH